jgi:hypothetical protein
MRRLLHILLSSTAEAVQRLHHLSPASHAVLLLLLLLPYTCVAQLCPSCSPRC